MSCESAQKTITDLYNNKEIDDCIAKMIEAHLRCDFKQELFLILLQLPCDNVEKMNGTFKFYVVGVLLNLARQENNVFRKTYSDKRIEYNTEKLEFVSVKDENDLPARINRENEEDAVILSINGIDKNLGNHGYPYHEKIIKLIAQYKSRREVGRIVGIPETTIRRTVNRVKEYLKK